MVYCVNTIQKLLLNHGDDRRIFEATTFLYGQSRATREIDVMTQKQHIETRQTSRKSQVIKFKMDLN